MRFIYAAEPGNASFPASAAVVGCRSCSSLGPSFGGLLVCPDVVFGGNTIESSDCDMRQSSASTKLSSAIANPTRSSSPGGGGGYE